MVSWWPHALAYAYKISERIILGAIVSGLTPANRPNPYERYKGPMKALMILGKNFQDLVYIFRRIAVKKINNPSGEVEDKFIKPLPKIYQIPFEDQQVKAMLIADIKEGYK